MVKQSCLTCNWIAYLIENKKNPVKGLFYCIKDQEIHNEITICEDYQEKSS